MTTAKRCMANRLRDFFVRTYLNEFTLLNLLNKNLNSITRFCFAKHDKDIYDDESPKEPHIHLILKFKDRKSINAVKNFFPTHNDDDDISQSTYVEFLENERIAVRYLIHKDNPDKFQYDSSIIYNHGYMVDMYLNDDLKIDKCDSAVLALTDLLSGIPFRDVALKYGRDFIIHYTQFRALLRDIHEQESFYIETNNDDCIDTFYVDFEQLPLITKDD